MSTSKALTLATDLPKLFVMQAVQPLRLGFRKPLDYPNSQQEMANLVNDSLKHQIRAGYTHRFINILFVTVGERVFCRRYSYGEPSWHSVFLADPEGQIKLDKTVVDIEAYQPDDIDEILPAVDKAYADKLKQLGARFLLDGAVEPRAQQSTIELKLVAKT